MSQLVEKLVWQIKAAKLPPPVREFAFAKPRRWRFDLSWIGQRVAVEVEGGIWTRGRHVRGEGAMNDMTKYNEAALRGWMLLRFSGKHIDDGTALATIERALSLDSVNEE